MKRRRILIIAITGMASVVTGCLDNDSSHNNSRQTEDLDETERNGMGKVQVHDEYSTVDSPYGDEPFHQLTVLNDEDEDVRATVEVFEGEKLIYEVELSIERGARYDGIRIGKEGEYEVRVETDEGSETGTWTVEEGYAGVNVEVSSLVVSNAVEGRGFLYVETADLVPDDAEVVSADTLAEQGILREAVEKHHSCERQGEDCDTSIRVRGPEWLEARNATDRYPVYRGNEGRAGIYIEHDGNIYVLRLETEL